MTKTKLKRKSIKNVHSGILSLIGLVPGVLATQVEADQMLCISGAALAVIGAGLGPISKTVSLVLQRIFEVEDER